MRKNLAPSRSAERQGGGEHMKGMVKKYDKEFSKSWELEYSWRLSKLSTIVPTAFAMKVGKHGDWKQR